MIKTTRKFKCKIRKRLKKETANLNRQYITTFKDIKKYFNKRND